MAKVGILGCESTSNKMNCVMIGCLGNLRDREGFFKDYPKGEPLDLVGIIHCGGCPTAVGAEGIWQKVQALVDYSIEALHMTSCLVHFCPFKDEFLANIHREYPNLKVVEGTHIFHDLEAVKAGFRELISQRVITPQSMNDLIFKRIKLAPEQKDQS